MPITAEFQTPNGQPLSASAPIERPVRVIPVPAQITGGTAFMDLTSFAQGGRADITTAQIGHPAEIQSVVLNPGEELPKTIVGQQVMFRGQ